MLLHMWNVHDARERVMGQRLVDKAKSDAKNQIPCSSKLYPFVVDYGQNMYIPSYQSKQPEPA